MEKEKKNKKKRIIIGTPTYDGKLDCRYVESLIASMQLCHPNQIQLIPIQIPFDALVMRARNDLFAMSVENKADGLFFVDSDQSWKPEDMLRMIQHPEHIIGGSVVKKSSTINFNIRKLNDNKPLQCKNGVCEIEGIGTGFMYIDKYALNIIWAKAKPYIEIIENQPIKKKMVFTTGINEDGELVSEDINFCRNAKKIGLKIFLDPYTSCNHFGQQAYYVDFMQWALSGQIIEFVENKTTKQRSKKK